MPAGLPVKMEVVRSGAGGRQLGRSSVKVAGFFYKIGRKR